jgi:hypothetical protein
MSDRPSKKSRAQRRREKRREGSGGRPWWHWALALAAVALIALAFADALGAFKTTSYTAVPHGNHSHYVPDECEDVRTGDFPMRAPGEDERITCAGQIVSE